MISGIIFLVVQNLKIAESSVSFSRVGKKRQNEGKQLSMWLFIVLDKMAQEIQEERIDARGLIQSHNDLTFILCSLNFLRHFI